MKVIVAHPGQQHSFKVASALKKNEVLFRYITAVYDKPNNLAMKLAHMLVKGRDVTKIAGRKNSDLRDEDVITYYTFLSLAVIVLSRFKQTKRLSYFLDRKIADLFGVKVAKYAIRHNVDAVICFSMNERTCFQYLKKHAPHIKRIVDCANSPVNYMRDIYEKDEASEELKKEAPTFWNSIELNKQQKGIDLTQYFLAPSLFVKKGLVFCGVSEDRIKVLSYGSNFTISDASQDVPNSVKFIYVGQVSHRKGMHYLLKAFSELEQFGVEIEVVGGWPGDSKLHNEYMNNKNIHFHGNIPHEKVEIALKNANVFVFDSLTEGLSLSCLEALSCGLPIICSTNSGVNDFIVDGWNGYVVEANNVNKLKEKILYFFYNPDVVKKFSENALKTAETITWQSYGEHLIQILTQLNE